MKTKPLFWCLMICCYVQIAGICGHAQTDVHEKNLRPLFDRYGLTVRTQGERGTCSVFAIVGLLEFEYAHRLHHQFNFSVEYLNWASNQVTSEIEDGSFFADALKGIHQFGICQESFFPYQLSKPVKFPEPSAQAIKDAKKHKRTEIVWIKEWDPNTGMTKEQVQQVKLQLQGDHPVAIGFQWPKNEERYRKYVNDMMPIPPREGVFDGHSVIIVGYKDDATAPGGGYFIFKNSHGPGYEDKGYGKMPYEYVYRYANDGVTIRVGKDIRRLHRGKPQLAPNL